MTPEAINSVVGNMPPQDDPEWSFEAARRADKLDAILSEGSPLREVASQLIAVAKAHGLSELLAASPSGDRIAAAAVTLAENGLRMAPADGRLGAVLLVDGLLVTGIQLVRALNEATTRGATRIHAVAVATLVPADQLGESALAERLSVLSD